MTNSPRIRSKRPRIRRGCLAHKKGRRPFRGGGLVDDSGPVSPGAYSFFFSITGAFCFQTAGFAVTHASGATLCAGWNSK